MKKLFKALFFISLFLVLMTISFSENVNAQGLVGYWKFDEGSGATAEDSSGYNNDGTIHGATWSSDCKSGNCLKFDGIDDYVRVEDSDSLDISKQITLTAWIHPYQLTGRREILSKLDAYWFNVQDGKLCSYLSGISSAYSCSIDSIPTNDWTHVAMTYDGSNMKLYINGQVDSSFPLTGDIQKTIDFLTIGIQPNNLLSQFDGIIDEVKVWNYALTEEEISEEYNRFCNAACVEQGYDSGVCRETAPSQLSIKTVLTAYGNPQNWPGDYFDYMAKFDLVDTDFLAFSNLPYMRNLNPDIKIIGYIDLMYRSNWEHCFYCDWDNIDPDWFLRDNLDNPIRTNPHPNYGYKAYVMNQEKQGYREYWLDWAMPYLGDDGFDGVFADDAHSGLWFDFPSQGYDTYGYDKDVYENEYFPDDEWNTGSPTKWQNAMIGNLEHQKERLGEKILIPNGGWIYTDYSDGNELENFVTYSNHLNHIEELYEESGKGKWMLAPSAHGLSVSMDQREYMRYCLSCFLLGVNGENAYFGWGNIWDALGINTWDEGGPYEEVKMGLDFDLIEKAEGLGSPEGKYENYQDNVYIRYFENGLVLANLDVSTSGEICIDGEYETLDGQSVPDCFTMNAKTGEILLKTTTGGGCLLGETSIGQDGCSSEYTCCCKSDLIAHWVFDEGSGSTVSDSSGYGNDGTLYGGLDTTGWTTDCISSSCLSFDGTDDYVSVSDSPSLSSPAYTKQATWMFWVKFNTLDFSFYWPTFLGKGFAVGSKEYDVRFINETKKIILSLSNGTHSQDRVFDKADWKVGEWYHITVTYINTTQETNFYVNGNFTDTKTFTMNDLLKDTAEPLEIGTSDFKGIIDEVKIYKRALTEEEIKNEYNPFGIANELDIRRFVYGRWDWYVENFTDLTDVYNAHFDTCYGIDSGYGEDRKSYPELIHQIRPDDYTTLLYRNVRACYSDADELQEFMDNDWLLRYANGSYAHSGGFGYYLVDIGNESYHEWLGNWYEYWLVEQNWTGLYLDNGIGASKYEVWWDVDPKPINPRTGQEWTPEEIVDAYTRMHSKLREIVGGEYIITANGIYDGDRWFLHTGKKDRYIEILRGLDGVLHEGWLTNEMNWYVDPYADPPDYSFKEGWYDEDKWKRGVDMIIGIDQLYPQITHIMDELACDEISWTGRPAPIPDTMPELRRQYANYIFTSLLLSVSTTNKYFMGLGWWGAENMQDLWEIDVGEPLNDYYTIDGTHVYARDFSKVKVLVNPNDTAYTVSLGGNYITLDGEIVSEITLENHTGVILENISKISCEQTISGLSTDTQDYFTYTLDSSMDVTIRMTPQSGADYDLYTNWTGGCPSIESWDCRPYNGTGVQENCSQSLSAGNYYFMIHNYSGSGSYNISLSCVSGTTTTMPTTSTTTPPDTEPPQWSNIYHDPIPPAVITTLDDITIKVTWSDDTALDTAIIWENSTGEWQGHVV